MSPDEPPTLTAVREPRKVGIDRAFFWYAEAMRTFRRHPLPFALLAFAVLLADVGLQFVPFAGAPASKVIIPVLACGLLYASLAIDRDDRPRLVHLLAPFTAPANALASVVLASLVVFGAEWFVAWRFADVNLLTYDGEPIEPRDALAIYGTGVVVSLPLTLVPLLALFEAMSARDAFASSIAAFIRNLPAFVLYGALSIALLGVGFVTRGLALLVVLPLWAASSYAAWKDLYRVE
jgi:uncharacterized membrane protein